MRPCLRGDVECLIVETGSAFVGHHKVKVGDIDMRLVPVNQRETICGHADVAWVGVAVDDAGMTTDEALPTPPDIEQRPQAASRGG